MKKLFLSLLAVPALLLCVSCDKPAPNGPNGPNGPNAGGGGSVLPPTLAPSDKEWMTKKMVIDATDYTKWVYLNFATGELVDVADPENDLSWDLGLHRYDFKTNGGTSGKGKGAAVRISKQKVLTGDIDTPKESDWTLDREGMLLMKHEGGVGGNHTGSECKMVSANFLLSSECEAPAVYINRGVVWQEGMPPQVFIDNAIYMIRSASGELVRLRVHDYQNAKKQRGYMTIEYAMLVEKK